MLLYENYYKGADKAEFIAKVIRICKALGINPDWLMAIMFHESGLNPQAVNRMGGATGLIQFMPSTAQDLKTTTQALYNMTGVQQLDYVYKYFASYQGRMKNFVDVALATFFPLAIGHTGNPAWIFQGAGFSPQIIAQYNPGFDTNKDGIITMGEYLAYMRKRFPVALFAEFDQKKV